MHVGGIKQYCEKGNWLFLQDILSIRPFGVIYMILREQAFRKLFYVCKKAYFAIPNGNFLVYQ